MNFQCYHSDIKVCKLSSLDIFRNLWHYIWYEGVYAILVDVYHLGTYIFVWVKVCLKDATDMEFLCSSLRLFQSLIIEGRKELYYWFVRALIIEMKRGSFEYPHHVIIIYRQILRVST